MVVKTSKIKILIVENQKSIDARLKYALTSVSDFKIIGIVESSLDAIANTQNLQPDIIILDLDIEMPEIEGIVITKIISVTCPNTKILVLSSQDNQEYINKSISVGARGYLFKSVSAEEMQQAIRLVHKGSTYICGGLLHDKLPKAQKSTKIKPNLAKNIISVFSSILDINPSQPQKKQPNSIDIKGQIFAWLILTLTLTSGVYAIRQWLSKPMPSITISRTVISKS